MHYLISSYDPAGVLASVLIGIFAAYVALDLARRVRTDDRRSARKWLLGGSVAMGTGIWAMHFVGMFSFSLPIALGYTRLLTALSWVSAVGVSAIALGIAAHGALTWQRLTVGALVMGAGISAMHYLGMAALDMTPGIAWSTPLIGTSVAIAVAASAAALLIFSLLRELQGLRGLAWQAAAALVMGCAISGMHYTGMAAAHFPQGSICASAGDLGGLNLDVMVGLAAVSLLALTLFTSVVDSRMRIREARSAESLKAAYAELQLANEQLQRQAFLDPLTGLPNRLLFEDRLLHAISRRERSDDHAASRAQEKLGVLFIDLDGFKPVNDLLGHAAGDEVLREAARRLRAIARDCDTVARVGGDEFLLLMEGVRNAPDCLTLARRLVESLAAPFDAAGERVEISASVGVVLYPDHGHRDRLVAHADIAMYAAKRAGGNTYVLFESTMDTGAQEQLNLQHDLRRAVELGQLQLYYQPKVDGRRGQISGVEALLRWHHPERGIVSPVVFIPIAERYGLINALGNWVINESCRQIGAWRDEGVRMRVAINLSVHQLREEDLVARIDAALRRHQVEPSQLLCEITESVAMEDVIATQRAFEGLARLGVFLSIDDFGTGYSSLSYLRQLPARQLKIDRSFIADLETSSDARAIVDAVVRMAHAMGLKVVAEGVETDGQRITLLNMGCDELQGYFFARPMPADALLAWAEGERPEGSVAFSPSVMHELSTG